MAWLVAVDGELAGRRFSLDAPCLVGRGPYNHVVLDDTRISRQHAKISPEPGGHVVYDLNSANGTFVNEVQVKRQKLSPADIVRFGPFTFRFESEALDRTGPLKVRGGKFMEVHTQVGAEPPSKIIDSLDASLATNPGVAARSGASSRTPIASCARCTRSCSRSRPRSSRASCSIASCATCSSCSPRPKRSQFICASRRRG